MQAGNSRAPMFDLTEKLSLTYFILSGFEHGIMITISVTFDIP